MNSSQHDALTNSSHGQLSCSSDLCAMTLQECLPQPHCLPELIKLPCVDCSSILRDRQRALIIIEPLSKAVPRSSQLAIGHSKHHREAA